MKQILLVCAVLATWGFVAATAVAGPVNEGVSTAARGDTDGDGIPDTIEKDPKYVRQGGSFRHKDLWVECDFMQRVKPSARVNQFMTQAYANAPLKNPDGKPGVKLHLKVDDQFPREDQWGDVEDIPNGFVQTYQKAMQRRQKSFDGDPRYVHYCMFVNAINDTSISGISLDSKKIVGGIPGDTFIVSLGRWGRQNTPEQQAGTLMHELGHNLGLKHGGNDHINYKPNYLSVMNYHFQTGFVSEIRPGTVAQVRFWDYSRFLANTLNERRLNELVGVRAPDEIAREFVGLFYCPNGDTFYFRFNEAVDFDCDGVASRSTVANVNLDQAANGSPVLSQLGTQDNWQHIIWDGGAIGRGFAPSEFLDPETELDLETYLELQEAILEARPANPN